MAMRDAEWRPLTAGAAEKTSTAIGTRSRVLFGRPFFGERFGRCGFSSRPPLAPRLSGCTCINVSRDPRLPMTSQAESVAGRRTAHAGKSGSEAPVQLSALLPW